MIKIDPNKLPRHIAIIMDGNGRWAKQHTMGRIRGHKKGAQAVRTTVTACREIGIQYLTLFAFSSENWGRPDEEVNALMSLLEDYLEKETPTLQKQQIRLNSIGNIEKLYPPVRKKLLDVMKLTEQNDKMVLNLALSYGSRDEMVMAIQKMISDSQKGKLAIDDINQDLVGRYLYTDGMPDPDLLIRTSGEYRISNFLLWQLAYTELYFTDVLWPDFKKDDLLKAITVYQRRERRFGLTSDQIIVK
ncbi:MAG: Ditrans,polycis-undecaprenyl-diphosphate synthase ((2E,6E)-farnesyl-diphosphate specific) [Deltaproteobacteria bacterium ADurb.Bin151]|nr:isoprenyl transferase [Smithella sp.]OQB54023.1 MAG: Ditrans,polycis-undecaprenyl-diphosphate synthase ((2E,6E)-farnesyl-diphosphate specific) [Deltaproteobacteria bacterium ADurb.Bin151]HQP24262.1 isoprenyl transferase [Smithellaceae bacterium]HRY35142.1 isoprenyl transferase [Smithellaceae bacterium]